MSAIVSCAVIAPAVVGAASTTDYTLNYSSGKIIRWDPCKTINYRVNLDRAPKGALTEVKEAVARVETVTGINFAYQGSTDRLPQSTWTNHVDRSKRLVIFAWAWSGSGDGHSTLLPSGAAGEGGWAAQSWTSDGVTHRLRIVAGFAIFNPSTYRNLERGFGSGETRGQLVLHELGHAMGLNHTTTRSQIMYPQIESRSRTAYGDGDRTGLHKLGRAAGCMG